ncbi:MAG: hypothetical protein EXS03_04365 [Phycisphaerales bacterium]|nr:hypothetical protein [Phycisphaerales bacterium]
MDRKRLGGVQQTDITESRINDDFVYWLKTSGPNWLLAVMVVAALVMGWNWWKNRAVQARDIAWSELDAADIPSSLKDVALKHSDIDSIPVYALLSAGDRYLQSVLAGTRFDREATASDAAITPELRTQWLAEANTLYGDVITAAKAAPSDRAGGMLGFEVSAWFGRATVAESMGDVDGARAALESAKRAAGDHFPWLVKNAQARIESLSQIAAPYPIPPAPVAALPPTVNPNPTNVTAQVDPLTMLLGDAAASAPSASATQPADPPTPAPAPTPAPTP